MVIINQTKDNVLLEIRIGSLGGILCALRFHQWKYWLMSKEFIEAFPRGDHINRSCSRCGVKEIWFEGARWKRRI